jgi:cell division septal protein FtsQ
MRYNPQRNNKHQKRTRFDVARAERATSQPIRLPRIRLGMVAVGVVLLAVLGGGIGYQGDAFRIRDIQVTNNTGVPMEQILGASGLQGEHYQFADLEAAAKRIDDLPGVEAAQVNCEWNMTTRCVIVVQPAQPLAIWLAPNGNVWTDYEGKVQRAPDQMAAKLTIKVEDGEPPTVGVPLDERMLRALNELVAETNQRPLARILYSSRFGFMMTNERSRLVRLGASEREGAMRQKLQTAKALDDQLMAQNISPKVIDVRFANAPYYIK